jgi:hypothetical protein
MKSEVRCNILQLLRNRLFRMLSEAKTMKAAEAARLTATSPKQKIAGG